VGGGFVSTSVNCAHGQQLNALTWVVPRLQLYKAFCALISLLGLCCLKSVLLDPTLGPNSSGESTRAEAHCGICAPRASHGRRVLHWCDHGLCTVRWPDKCHRYLHARAKGEPRLPNTPFLLFQAACQQVLSQVRAVPGSLDDGHQDDHLPPASWLWLSG
jgi:hypothetical protein